MFFRKRQRIIRDILIVEDEPLVAFDNELHLADAGFHVVATVDNAPDALVWLERTPVQLVLADISLRSGSGVDVARNARERNIAVLFAAGSAPSGAEDLATGFLAKPYSARELVRAVQAVDRMLRDGKTPPSPRGLIIYPRKLV